MRTISVAEKLADALIAANLATLVEAAPVLVPMPAPPSVDRNPPADDGGAWPRILNFAQPFGDNVKVLADALINWQWLPSLNDIMFGQQGRILSDPSNGKRVNMPLRSPAGFPLHYAEAPDGKGGSVAVGAPSVMYSNDGFVSDAEVFDYMARVKAAAPTAGQTFAAWDQTFERMRQQGQAPLPNVPNTDNHDGPKTPAPDGDIVVPVAP